MSRPRTLILVLVVALVTSLLAFEAALQVGSAHEEEPPAQRGASGNEYRASFDLRATGWTIIDIPIHEPTDLRFHLTHDWIDNLCMFSQSGGGYYDEGHHTIVHMWPVGDAPFSDGRFFAWLGNPHTSLPVLQTGICGESDPLHFEAGQTARVVVATSVPGYGVAILGANATIDGAIKPLSLSTHPNHRADFPDQTAIVSEESLGAVVSVEREWRSVYDGGPALFYGVPWVHVDRHEDEPLGGFYLIGFEDWGFEGANEHAAHAPYPQTRGSLGTEYESVDFSGIFAGWTEGGHVEGYVVDQAVVGAYAGDYDAGAQFIHVPIAP